MRVLSPAAVPPPLARYSHAVEIPAGARLVAVSGQLGIGADGAVPPDAEAQARLCFAQIAAILAEAGMTLADVVKLTAYVTDRAHAPAYMRVRDAVVADPPPASTLLVVSGFTRPEFLVEVEALAARAG